MFSEFKQFLCLHWVLLSMESPVFSLCVYRVLLCQGFVDHLIPLSSLLRMGRELVKNPCGCVIFWISLVNVWLMCWSFACYSFMLVEPLFLAIGLALRSLLLLIVLFAVDFFFSALIKIIPASSVSESAGFQGLPCPCVIIMAAQLGGRWAQPQARMPDFHSSYLWFCSFLLVTSSSFALCFWLISRGLKWLFW